MPPLTCYCGFAGYSAPLSRQHIPEMGVASPWIDTREGLAHYLLTQLVPHDASNDKTVVLDTLAEILKAIDGKRAAASSGVGAGSGQSGQLRSGYDPFKSEGE